MTIAHDTAISIVERNDPLLRLKFTSVDRSTDPATRTPYDLTGNTDIEFYIKTGVSVADSAATKVYKRTTGEVAVVGAATAGEITVQVTGADIPKAGTYRYRVDVLKADGKRETVMAGPLAVINH